MSALERLVGWVRSVAPPRRDPAARLVDCSFCGADTVVPVRWEEAGDTQWWMRLRCGTCGTVREAVLDDKQASAFADDLDRGAERLAEMLAELEREGMLDVLRSLEAALARDLIDAADFAPRPGPRTPR